MWRNTYKDYQPDESFHQIKVDSGKGIVGSEMNELNGWGEKRHIFFPKKKKKLSFWRLIFRRKGS